MIVYIASWTTTEDYEAQESVQLSLDEMAEANDYVLESEDTIPQFLEHVRRIYVDWMKEMAEDMGYAPPPTMHWHNRSGWQKVAGPQVLQEAYYELVSREVPFQGRDVHVTVNIKQTKTWEPK